MARRALALFLLSLTAGSASAQDARPNILWISSEDNGPNIGAFGDAFATTPNLDRLAAGGLRFVHAWSTAPVCAPARTAIISGLYPSSTGAEHMRSLVRLPAGMRMFPALLRDAGYYTTNNAKEDYNLVKAGDEWDESSTTAHWRHRKPGQPFFAVFNINESHESFLQKKSAPKTHDPAKVRVPAYHPDVPEVREDWAAYYDAMTVMDRLAGDRLAELDEDGLAGDTIVFYFGDNGVGMPRSKRWPYNSGLSVPMIVRVPPKFRHLAGADYGEGAASARLVGFVDLAPTVLSLAGVKPPDWMQGRAFLGRFAAPAPEYAFGLRGRMDERYDLVRSVRDRQHVYVRHFMPHRIYGQHIPYMFLMPTTRVWKALYDQGKLSPPQTFFWEPKPSEELYDLRADPDEVNNLAADARHRPVLERMRRVLFEHLRATRDVGFLPEYELHPDGAPAVPYERGHDPARYDIETVLSAASRASDRSVPADRVGPGLTSPDPITRYWAATGMLVRGQAAVDGSRAALARLLDDPAPGPRIVAAEALARFGPAAVRQQAIAGLLKDADAVANPEYVSLLALNALAHVADLPRPAREAIARLPRVPKSSDQRENYVARIIESMVEESKK